MLTNKERREQVEGILRNPGRHEWSLQGFGMLRTYLTPDKVERLHVWSNPHQTPDVSLLHDHPWGFKSEIIAGMMTDVEYVPSSTSPFSRDWLYHQIICGPGGCAKSEVQEIKLVQLAPEAYGEGHEYGHEAPDIHASYPIDGTVSVITRKFGPDTETARVFWRPGEKWVSAEPRPATPDEINTIVGAALRNWF